MRLLVTGSRDWPESGPMRDKVFGVLGDTYVAMGEIDRLADITLVVGDCPTGIDKIAREIWEEQGFEVEVFVADWTKFGRAAGPKRNLAMVMSGADRCLAFPLGVSRGTRGCAQLAIAEKIPTQIFEGEHHEDW